MTASPTARGNRCRARILPLPRWLRHGLPPLRLLVRQVLLAAADSFLRRLRPRQRPSTPPPMHSIFPRESLPFFSTTAVCSEHYRLNRSFSGDLIGLSSHLDKELQSEPVKTRRRRQEQSSGNPKVCGSTRSSLAARIELRGRSQPTLRSPTMSPVELPGRTPRLRANAGYRALDTRITHDMWVILMPSSLLASGLFFGGAVMRWKPLVVESEDAGGGLVEMASSSLSSILCRIRQAPAGPIAVAQVSR